MNPPRSPPVFDQKRSPSPALTKYRADWSFSPAAVAVHCRGHWFYIDADVTTKNTLALFRELTRLRKVGAAEGQPLLTLPVGG